MLGRFRKPRGHISYYHVTSFNTWFNKLTRPSPIKTAADPKIIIIWIFRKKWKFHWHFSAWPQQEISCQRNGKLQRRTTMTNQSFYKILMMKDPEIRNGTIVAISQLHQQTAEMLYATESGVLQYANKVGFISTPIRSGQIGPEQPPDRMRTE